jgi:hypothetical protein
VIKPSFLIIGAQKCGTTWLWEMLEQHPGTDLRVVKEIFFFSSSDTYRRGPDWYYDHFRHLDPSKITGEASTDYFYDRVLIDNLEVDHSLPTIPELASSELPDVKVFVVLRDPVQRAISAYYHHLRRRRYSPSLDIREAAERHPRLRIIERGHYAQYMRLWKEAVPPERMRCFVFEEDVVKYPEETVKEAYSFLNLDVEYAPDRLDQPRNRGWNWSHVLLNYYTGPLYGKVYRLIAKTPMAGLLDRVDFAEPPSLKEDDIEYLRSLYLPEREELENLLGRSLECWSYGLL